MNQFSIEIDIRLKHTLELTGRAFHWWMEWGRNRKMTQRNLWIAFLFICGVYWKTKWWDSFVIDIRLFSSGQNNNICIQSDSQFWHIKLLSKTQRISVMFNATLLAYVNEWGNITNCLQLERSIGISHQMTQQKTRHTCTQTPEHNNYCKTYFDIHKTETYYWCMCCLSACLQRRIHETTHTHTQEKLLTGMHAFMHYVCAETYPYILPEEDRTTEGWQSEETATYRWNGGSNALQRDGSMRLCQVGYYYVA